MGILISIGRASATGQPLRAHAAYAQQCADPYSAVRDRSNPLGLARPLGADPLTGGKFFVDGPRHGDAAGAIAKLLGRSRSCWGDREAAGDRSRELPGQLLLGSFPLRPQPRRTAHELEADPALAYQVQMLDKIAAAPEEQRFTCTRWEAGLGRSSGRCRRAQDKLGPKWPRRPY